MVKQWMSTIMSALMGEAAVSYNVLKCFMCDTLCAAAAADLVYVSSLFYN